MALAPIATTVVSALIRPHKQPLSPLQKASTNHAQVAASKVRRPWRPLVPRHSVEDRFRLCKTTKGGSDRFLRRLFLKREPLGFSDVQALFLTFALG